MTPRPSPWLMLAAAGFLGWAAGCFVSPEHAMAGYLVAWSFSITLLVAALVFILVHHATDAGWSTVVRRLAEHVLAAMPVIALAAVPILLGSMKLYRWANANDVADDPLYAPKAAYLNLPFFAVRTALILAAWVWLARWFVHQSLAQDADADPARSIAMRKWSGPALIVVALTLSFASFDWLMSLDFHWYSTIFGVYVFAGAAASGYALLAILLVALRSRVKEHVADAHVHDLGKWFFVFCCFWGYIAFSQFMLIYYANIPEETLWFLERWQGPYAAMTVLMVGGMFVLPLVTLMPAWAKRHRIVLPAVAMVVLAAHWVEMLWLVMPSAKAAWSPAWLALDGAALVMMIGLFGWAVSRSMAQHGLVPIHDPRLGEVDAAILAEHHERDLASDNP